MSNQVTPTQTALPRTTPADYLKYFASLLIFGTNGIVADGITMTSEQIVFLRTLIGAPFLALLFFGGGHRPQALRRPATLLSLFGSGFCMGASWIFLFEAYARVGVSVATLLYYCGPVMVLALSPLVFKEKLTGAKLGGIALVMAGMALVNGFGMAEGELSGVLCGVMSAVLYAGMVICNKRVKGLDGLENTLWQLTFAFVTVFTWLLVRHTLPTALPAGSLPRILLLGVVNTGLACYLYFSSISRLPAQTVAICSYLDPLSALLFSALFLSERLTALQWLGAALVLGGAAFGELAGRKKRRNP
ncbi:MAG: DMT family transporter [Clostridia bacterium]|nr:DMT family transporter [Clostridia bacterium]